MLGEFGEVLVVDWGLAALCSAARRAAPTLQAPALDRDLISGSPGFIAPERLRPPLPPPDPRADQWSLGAVLYAVLSGSPPYTSHDPRAAIHDTLAGPPEDVRLRDPDRDVPD